MYPNPASSKFILRSATEMSSVSISSVTGQMISSVSVNALSAEMNISDLDAGMYIISVKFESDEVSNQILIKK
jgi:hypothetical protein